MTLSVSMIAKNEAKTIGAAIASASTIADEIVVVDTGSKDDTVDVATNAGAMVVASEKFTRETPWSEFHFADARNEALAVCSGDWILSLDCDETIVQDRLLDYIHDTQFHSFEVTIRMPMMVATVPRLFRNGLGYKYQYRCHEVPTCVRYFGKPADTHGLMPKTILQLVHHRDEKYVSGHLRNIALLRREHTEAHEAQERENILRTCYELGRSYRALKMWGEALGFLTIGEAMVEPEPNLYIAHLFADIGECYMHSGIFGLAKEYAAKSVEYIDCPNGYLLHAEIERRLGNAEASLEFCDKALATGKILPESLVPKMDRVRARIKSKSQPVGAA